MLHALPISFLLIIRIIFGEYNHKVPQYAISSTLLLPRPSCIHILPQHPILKHPQPVTTPLQCGIPSFTPVQDRHNYSSVYFNPYSFGQKTGRQNSRDRMVAGIPSRQPALSVFTNEKSDALLVKPACSAIYLVGPHHWPLNQSVSQILYVTDASHAPRSQEMSQHPTGAGVRQTLRRHIVAAWHRLCLSRTATSAQVNSFGMSSFIHAHHSNHSNVTVSTKNSLPATECGNYY